MGQKLQQIPEWRDVDEKTFTNEIITRYRPAVLRGLVKNWPVVQHGIKSPESVCNYLKAFDNGSLVCVVTTRPEDKGRIAYRDGLDGFSFVLDRLPISAVIDQLLKHSVEQNPSSVAAQSARIAECIPGFLTENKPPVLDQSILPRIWIGNKITVPAHFDQSHNLACSVSGRRRFTLFPPEQVSNLYIGPLDYTPAGAPISMVWADDPDLKQYPRYREALAAAQIAELEPGDAIYIPALWWHQVESLEKVNVLINYWWGGPIGSGDDRNPPADCLTHCLLEMKDLAPELREAWKMIFNHYVFNTGHDPAEHIPKRKRGILGSLSAEKRQQIKAGLAQALMQKRRRNRRKKIPLETSSE